MYQLLIYIYIYIYNELDAALDLLDVQLTLKYSIIRTQEHDTTGFTS